MASSRRLFLGGAILAWLGVAAFLLTVAGGILLAPASQEGKLEGYGPLVKDRAKILDLPKGFSYTIIARAGDKMTDGFYVPGLADGMSASAGPDETTILVCNHEYRVGYPASVGPFKGKKSLSGKVGRDMIYDPGNKGHLCLGSTTTLIYDTNAHKLKSHFLNMVGTLVNCSGTITPSNTWLSSEEVFENPGEDFAQRHGYVFEGPISTEPRVIKPVALKAMGRFKHEGIAVSPQTGVVLLTEDQIDGLLYRFVPDKPGQLAEGGRLQCLAVMDKPQFDTRNWKGAAVSPGEVLPVYWIDLDNVDPETDDLRMRGYKLGAALFAGAEGICMSDGIVYFDCTNGSRTGRGQVWSYTPSPLEGTPGEKESPARLELLVEPNDELIMDHPDQITVAPWGDIFVCEDGNDGNYLLGITPQREIYKFAWNALNESDLSGACFSPDGSTMFLNILEPGLTLAVIGPWKRSPEN
jgi:secreted PhoX family phosphatase